MNAPKEIVLAALKAVGMFAALRRLCRDRVAILAYHGVDQSEDPLLNFDGLQVSPERFSEHLAVLSRGWRVRPLADVVRRLVSGDEPEPNTAVITFDDGYRNNLTQAAPLLKSFEFPATFFVTTGFLDGTCAPWWYRLRAAVSASKCRSVMIGPDRIVDIQTLSAKMAAVAQWERELRDLPARDREERLARIVEACQTEPPPAVFPMLNWQEVRSLIGMGFEVGAHTVSHVSLAREDAERARSEIVDSVNRVQAMTGTRPRSCSFPYGQAPGVGNAADALLKEMGMCCAVTTVSGMNRAGDDPYRLRRLNVTGGHSPAAFESLLSGFTSLVK